MKKTNIAQFASANGFNASYSGNTSTWHFTNRENGKQVSRKTGKG